MNISDLPNSKLGIYHVQVKYFQNAWQDIEKKKASSIPCNINGHSPSMQKIVQTCYRNVEMNTRGRKILVQNGKDIIL